LARVSEHAKAHFDGYADATPGTERQRAAVRDALAALEDILPEAELELVAENLRHAADAMGRVTGRIGVEEVLGEIFSRLCVGK
jgi:tRNA modification GTPase